MPTAPKRITIIGGGLAGLTAAATAARAGADVVVHEACGELGGRARSVTTKGFVLNQGPHALYASGPGAATLADFGIKIAGKKPPTSGGYGRLDGKIGLLPGSPIDALKSRLVGIKTKVQLAKLVANPNKMLKTDTSNRSMQQWIDEQVSDPDARLIMAMVGRLSTYVDDMATIAADVAVQQAADALINGVWYLDDGWHQLVDALQHCATAAGAKIDTSTKIDSIDDVRISDATIIAIGGPTHASKFVGDRSNALRQWATDAQPVFAASLDVGLTQLPNPKRRVYFGLNDPFYCSVHTPSAKLTEGDGEVMHVMCYGNPVDDPRGALEAFVEQWQPGWRKFVVAEQYGRKMVVSHDRPKPGLGLKGRPGPKVPDLDDVFVAGDWVGPRGLLADAAIASGRDAAMEALGLPHGG